MSSASNGRKNRPRSAGNIFQIGKPPHRDPQRRESTESTRRAQRAVADCRMVGRRHVRASMARRVMLFCEPVFVPETVYPPGLRDAGRQLLLAAKRSTEASPGSLKIAARVWRCFVGIVKTNKTPCVYVCACDAFGVHKAAGDSELLSKIA